MAWPCVEEPPLVVEHGGRAGLARVGADHRQVDRVDRPAQRALGHAEHRVDRRTALALSVALDEVAPEALAEAVPVAHGGLRPEGTLERVVGVVGSFGSGEDVRDRLAHVAELGGTEAAHVVEEGGGAEAGPHGDGGPDHDRRPPQRHEGVAVEERHGAVADVVGRVAVARGGHLGDAGQPALGAPDGLGDAGRPRGEDQEVQRVLVDVFRPLDQCPGRRRAGEPGHQLLVARAPDDEHLVVGHTEREPFEQRGSVGVGDDHGAVGGPHVGGERLAPSGRVDPDDRRARQRGAVQPEQVLGPVGQEQADVGRTIAHQ